VRLSVDAERHRGLAAAAGGVPVMPLCPTERDCWRHGDLALAQAVIDAARAWLETGLDLDQCALFDAVRALDSQREVSR
jgi:hypothetical protein